METTVTIILAVMVLMLIATYARNLDKAKNRISSLEEKLTRCELDLEAANAKNRVTMALVKRLENKEDYLGRMLAETLHAPAFYFAFENTDCVEVRAEHSDNIHTCVKRFPIKDGDKTAVLCKANKLISTLRSK